MIVKYNGKYEPDVAGQQIYPGTNEIKNEPVSIKKSYKDDKGRVIVEDLQISRIDFFKAHLETDLGKAEIKRGDWVIVEDSKPEKEEEKSFEKLPVVKQKEIILETYDENYLKELLDIDGLAKGTKKAINERLDELAYVPEEKDDSEIDE